MEFKELTVAELSCGYSRDRETGRLTCIFCGEEFEEGLIYRSRGRNATAQRAMAEHIFDRHGGVFQGLVQLDKQINGLSDAQKDILTGMYEGTDNKELGEALHISAATVRTHKFNLQKMKRQAQILLAIMAQIEDETLVAARKQLEQDDGGTKNRGPLDFSGSEQDYHRNMLHPFFTQFDLK